MKAKVFSPRRKDRVKVIRTFLEVIILALLLWALIRAYFFAPRYQAWGGERPGSADSGFIALSYFGVDREGTPSLISADRLRVHLTALRDAGYVTVSQRDIADYCNTGKPLPERALFLMFEDGRNDTVIFAQPILEECNFQATVMTYAGNLDTKDPKFLGAKDLRELLENSYYEMGTNGWQLSYINVFDRFGVFLDQLDSLKFQMVSSYLDNRYDHYLMDYIRDEYNIPRETRVQLDERLTGDYENMRAAYDEAIGAMPGAYVLMHSNSGAYGSGAQASAINEREIKSRFAVHFNREGTSWNGSGISAHDLTRAQPRPDWRVNHLLMRVWQDTGRDIAFAVGDPALAAGWETLFGAAEFDGEQIVLTTLPDGAAAVRSRTPLSDGAFRLTVTLDGNVLGGQGVLLCADDDLSSGVSVRLKDNRMIISRRDDDGEEELFSMDLDEFDGVVPQTWEENRREAVLAEQDMRTVYAETPEEAAENLQKRGDLQSEFESAPPPESAPYTPRISASRQGSRALELVMTGGGLTVMIDGRVMAEHIDTGTAAGQTLALEAAFSSGDNERKQADNIYDAVFTNFLVETLAGDAGPIAVVDHRLQGAGLLRDRAERTWNSVVSWFIVNL